MWKRFQTDSRQLTFLPVAVYHRGTVEVVRTGCLQLLIVMIIIVIVEEELDVDWSGSS